MSETYSLTAKFEEQKTSLKDKWMTETGDLWAHGPLTEDMIQYAAGDVTALVPEVYETQKRYIAEHHLEDKLNDRIVEEIMISVDKTMQKQHRDPVNHMIKHVLTEFDKRSSSVTVYGDITDEDVIMALKRIDFKAKKISTTTNRLKTECITAELDEIEETLRENDEVVLRSKSIRSLWRFEKHTDKHIRDRARALQEQLHVVLVNLIPTKYSIGTQLYCITASEREALKMLRPETVDDQSFTPVVLDVYWRKMESDLYSTIQGLTEQGKLFKIKERYYKKIKLCMHWKRPYQRT